MTKDPSSPSVIKVLTAVKASVGAVAKTDRNTQQGFSFRGIDAVVNAVSAALIEHGVVTVPEVTDYQYGTVEVGQKRTPMGHVRLTVAYHFHGPAGDKVTAVAPGEAFDSGDKATPKAMSVAYRTALLQTLTLPTDEADPDASSYERAPEPETDQGWLERMNAVIAAAATTDQMEKIKAEIGAEYRAGKISTTDSDHLLNLFQQRYAALAGDAA